MAIRVAAPAGEPVTIRIELPAGLQIDRAELERLEAAGTLAGYRLTPHALTMTASPLAPAQSFEARLRAIPTLAGTLQSGPATIRLGSVEVAAPPQTWSVER